MRNAGEVFPGLNYNPAAPDYRNNDLFPADKHFLKHERTCLIDTDHPGLAHRI